MPPGGSTWRSTFPRLFRAPYEAVVKVPHRLVDNQQSAAADRHATALLGPGSPVRYYLPGAPVTFAATLAALIIGWDTPNDRRWLMAAAACSMAGGAMTAYLVRAVNLPLLFADQPLAPDEQDRLLRTWYRLNALRLVAVGGAWLTAQQASSRAD